MISYVLIFAASAGAAFIATPLVRRLAVRAGAIDHPSDRKVHPRPTPTLGGLAVFFGVAIGVGVSWLLPFFTDMHRTTSEPIAAVGVAAVVAAVGVLDDVRTISPPAKLAGQVLAAGLLVLTGVQLLYFYVPGQEILVLSPDLAVPLTILWVLAMVNAVNLIDGLDGLAAGMVAIAALAFFAYVFWGDVPASGSASSAALLSVTVAGAAVGFLPWNFHPARIFMGDTGAMPLGLLLAVATISGVGRNAYPPAPGDLAAFSIPILVPLLVLAIPILDVALAIGRRIRRGRAVTHADKEHIHHRLLDIGHTHRQAVLLLYLWSALISGSALAVALIDGRMIVGITLLLCVGIFLGTLLPRLVRANGSARRREAEPSGAQTGAARRVSRAGK